MKYTYSTLKIIGLSLTVLPIFFNASEKETTTKKKPKKSFFQMKKSEIKPIESPFPPIKHYQADDDLPIFESPSNHNEETIEWNDHDSAEPYYNSDIDEETEAAAGYYTEAWFFSDPVTKEGLKWASAESIKEKDRSTAAKAMDDAINGLLKKNEGDWQSCQDQTIYNLKNKNKTERQLEQTECIIHQLKTIQKTEQRLEVVRFIIKNKSDIQLDEKCLKGFHDVCETQEHKNIKCLADFFNLELHNLERLEKMRKRAFQKSLKPENINYQLLNTTPLSIFEKAMQKTEIEKKETAAAKEQK